MSCLTNKYNVLGKSWKESAELLSLRISTPPESSKILSVKIKNSKIEPKKEKQIMTELEGRLLMPIPKLRNCRKPSITWQERAISTTETCYS
jgi:hypothetical protein